MEDLKNITPSSRLYGLTPEQKQKIIEFRSLLETSKQPASKSESDSELARWLRVTRWDMNQALDMYSKHKFWKQFSLAYQTIDSRRSQLEVMSRLVTRVIWGHDLESRPVMYYFVSKSKYREVEHELPTDLMIITMLVKATESSTVCQELSLRHDKLIDQFTSVIDLQGLNFGIVRDCVSKLAKQITMVTHCNFPDSAHQILIVNGPITVLKPTYELVKPLLAKSTRDKIKFLSNSEAMTEFISKEQLPKMYNGTNDDPPEDFSLPDEIFKSFEKVSTGMFPKMRKIIIPSKTLHFEPLSSQSCSKGEEIKFRICTEKDPLIYEIAFSATGHNPETPSSFLKSNTHEIVHDRTYQCPIDGYYFLAIDNTGQMLSKRIVYIEITSASELP